MVEKRKAEEMYGGWKPADGESPEEREKRIKREKRAQYLAQSQQSPVAQSGEPYQQTPEVQDNPAPTHPQNQTTHKQPGPEQEAEPVVQRIAAPKEKTTAKKNYLKRKKIKAKAKKAATPRVEPKILKKRKVKEGEELDEQAMKEREEMIRLKKEERREKRLAKKEEKRRAGGEVDVLMSESVVTEATKKEEVTKDAEKEARKESKRLKREARRNKEIQDGQTDDAKANANVSRQGEMVEPEAKLPDKEGLPEQNEDGHVEMNEVILVDDPKGPAPLLRLPTASRPTPPSAKLLHSLQIHSSVRNKIVVDKTTTIPFDSLGLGKSDVTRLREMGLTDAFAVQTRIIPLLTEEPVYSSHVAFRDVCVSAPTGSGKTLSYVVPIVNTLRGNTIRRLRALVILPTRELIGQVKDIFTKYAKGSELNVGIVTGQHSFAHEQSMLVSESKNSNVDILIATPGRLIDHLNATRGFTLQHLRFLVIDEADRLLTQSFQDWLTAILSALKPTFASKPTGALAPKWWAQSTGKIPSDVAGTFSHNCQKLLFSATLSRDPAKISALHLHQPIYVSVEDPDAGSDAENGKYTFPSNLKEYMQTMESSYKPLHLFQLLHLIYQKLDSASVLCFTKSVASTTRLSKLLEFFQQEMDASAWLTVNAESYSSELTVSERTKVLDKFRSGQVQILISSDLIARGIDLQVTHVVSYDIPTNIGRYVHRVGRTARANREGYAYNLVENTEAAPFRSMMRDAQHWEQINRVRVSEKLLEPFVGAYQNALEKLNKWLSMNGRDEE